MCTNRQLHDMSGVLYRYVSPTFITTIIITTTIILSSNMCQSAVDCPSGDTPGIVEDGKTCVDLVNETTKKICYNSAVETHCCNSCNAVNTNVQDCEYGDRTSCYSFFCPSYTDQTQCCSTCSNTSVNAITSTTTTAAPATTTTLAATKSTTSAVTVTTSSSSSTTNSPGTSQSSDSESNDVGAIIGGTIGGVAVVTIVACAIIIGVLMNKKSRDNKVTDYSDDDIPFKRDNSTDAIISVAQTKSNLDSSSIERTYPVIKQNDQFLKGPNESYINDKVSVNSDKAKMVINGVDNEKITSVIHDTDKHIPSGTDQQCTKQKPESSKNQYRKNGFPIFNYEKQKECLTDDNGRTVVRPNAGPVEEIIHPDVHISHRPTLTEPLPPIDNGSKGENESKRKLNEVFKGGSSNDGRALHAFNHVSTSDETALSNAVKDNNLFLLPDGNVIIKKGTLPSLSLK